MRARSALARAWAAVAALAVPVAGVAVATGYLELTLEEIASRSEIAVHGEVVAIVDEVVAGLPWTLVTIAVERDLLAAADTDEGSADENTGATPTADIVLPLLGGPLPGGGTLAVEGMPDFAIGDRVVVLAYRERFASPIVGFAQGLWREDELGLVDDLGRALSLDADGLLNLDGAGGDRGALLDALAALLAERP